MTLLTTLRCQIDLKINGFPLKINGWMDKFGFSPQYMDRFMAIPFQIDGWMNGHSLPNRWLNFWQPENSGRQKFGQKKKKLRF